MYDGEKELAEIEKKLTRQGTWKAVLNAVEELEKEKQQKKQSTTLLPDIQSLG